MKTFLKVFIVSFLFFFVAFYIGANVYIQQNNEKLEGNIGIGFAENINVPETIISKLEVAPKEPEEFGSLEEAFLNSNRINFLILGLEDTRSDTIILASFCQDSKRFDLIAIPRDTYVHRKGYNDGEKRKINSVYYDHGVDGVKKTISYILPEIPIHHNVMIDYEGVEKIVDLVGGVEMDVPFHMRYRDPTSKPPLDIDIKAGNQILDGKQSLDFIRYRKGNNRTGYHDGDLGRIKAQQDFLKAFASKAMDNAITVITRGLKYVDTDVKFLDALSYGRNIIGISSEDIQFRLLPGKSDFREVNRRIYSYYIYNDRDIKTMLEEIYNVK
ncbi:MAG: LytR family transcriptional regulator [Tissierella sp.]|nr:LytR family transcriptional regulator [Tissierella sp.]